MRLFPDLAAVAAICGAGLATWSGVTLGSPWPLLLAGLGAVVLAACLRAVGIPAAPMVLAAAVLLGAWRGGMAGDTSVALVPTGPTKVTVVVSDAPVISGSRVRFRGTVVADQSGEHGSVPDGVSLLVHTLPPADLVVERGPPYLRYGDTLRLSGELERPEPIGDFDYAAWLESQGISGVLWSREIETVGAGGGNWAVWVLHGLRSRLASSLQRSIRSPESGLAQALLLGIRSELPAAVKDSFRTAGMSHLLAISGLHVGIVLALSLGVGVAMLGKGNPWAILCSTVVVWLYAVMSGLDPPVVRAAIMGTLALAQGLTGRGMRGLTALVLAAGVMVCVEPALLQSLSFQLSFTAMAGVIVGLPLITLTGNALAVLAGGSEGPTTRWVHYVLTLLIASVVISTTTTLATVPLIAMHFGEIPLMSVPATILAMPAMPVALVTSAITAVSGIALPWVSPALGVSAWAPVTWIIVVAQAMPPLMAPADWLTPQIAVAWYAALAALVLLMSSRRMRRIASAFRRGPRWRPSGVAGVLLGVVPVALLGTILLLTQVWDTRSDGLLHVHVLDIGQGDAILLVTPQGRQLLVDGGPDPRAMLNELGRLLPAGDRSLDAVVVTHLDSDHAGGLLGILDRYDTDLVLQGSANEESALYHQWQSVIDQRGHPTARVQAGHRIRMDSGVALEILNPPAGTLPRAIDHSANNLSVVMRLSYGDVSFLLAGDIEKDVETHLVQTAGERLQSDVLKVAHHGSRTSTSVPFLQAVEPKSAVISAGANNRYGHPHPDVMERLAEAVDGSNLLVTSRDGAVEFVTDGTGLWVNTYPRSPR